MRQDASQAAAAIRSVEKLTGSQKSKGVRGQRQPNRANSSQQRKGASSGAAPAGRKQHRETAPGKENACMPPPAKRSVRQALKAAQGSGESCVAGAVTASQAEHLADAGPAALQRKWVPETEMQG